MNIEREIERHGKRVHFVQGIQKTGNKLLDFLASGLEYAEAGQYLVSSNFMILYTARNGKSELLVAGEYQDQVRFGPEGPRFQSKKAVLDTVAMPRYLVYPV